jgi:hypothetical protein
MVLAAATVGAVEVRVAAGVVVGPAQVVMKVAEGVLVRHLLPPLKYIFPFCYYRLGCVVSVH